MGTPRVDESSFGAFYYAHCCGRPYERSPEWLAFFGGIAARIATDIAPRRVLDAGCALGLLVEALRERHIDAFGIDLSSFAIERVPESVRPFCRQGSVAGDLGGPYDLIVCIEVLEHMPARDAEIAVDGFCRAAPDVLFSSSPFDYKEPTHVNVHPPEYWAELFARHGLYRDVDFDASFVTPWAVRFRRSAEPVHRLVRQYERRFSELQTERGDLRARAGELQDQLSQALSDLEQARARLPEAEQALADTHRELAAARTALAGAEDTVFHMERSLFWRLRTVWVRARRLFG